MSEETTSKSKSGKGSKFLWDLLDRVMFIGIGVIGTVVTSYITGMIKLNPPELVARPAYSSVEAGSVTNIVGGLKLDYKEDAPTSYGILRVDIANEGRGSAEKVRFQVKLPAGLPTSYDSPPDFKVYSPSQIGLDAGEFYAVLEKFPSGASDWLALRVDGEPSSLCGTRIKFVNDDYEGEVASLKGVEGCR